MMLPISDPLIMLTYYAAQFFIANSIRRKPSFHLSKGLKMNAYPLNPNLRSFHMKQFFMKKGILSSNGTLDALSFIL